MDENIKPLLIYLPALHPELAPDTLPASLLDEVFFLDPGLGQNISGYKLYTSPKLVYSPKEAQACLNDMVAFQSEMEELSTVAARRIVDNFWGSLSELENEELKEFVREGGKTAKKSPDREGLYREVCEQAQKNLLLAWSQEENILDIGELLKQLGQSSSRLAENLDEPRKDKVGSGQASIDGMVDLIMQESGMVADDLRVQWSASLIGALCLTEPETVFCTTAAEFERLLAEICQDDDSRPEIADLDDELNGRLAMRADLKQGFKVCEVSYQLLLSAYSSPLLQRLVALDGKKREFVRFVFNA